MRTHLTTVQAEFVESLRVVACAAVGDGIDEGEEIARFPRGTSLAHVRKLLVEQAESNRGVSFAADVFTHKGVWERFVSVCYEPHWAIDKATGIILEGRAAPTDTVAAFVSREREAFERERGKRVSVHNRRARAAEKYVKTGSDH